MADWQDLGDNQTYGWPKQGHQYRLKLKGAEVRVVRDESAKPPGWRLICLPWFDDRALKADTPDAAKAEALALVKQAMIGDLEALG